MEQCDLIFGHSFMDEYTLQCLSDWNIDKQPQLAVKQLSTVVKNYPDLKFVRAACNLEIARLYKQMKNMPQAYRYFELLAQDKDPGVAAYRAAAANPDPDQD